MNQEQQRECKHTILMNAIANLIVNPSSSNIKAFFLLSAVVLMAYDSETSPLIQNKDDEQENAGISVFDVTGMSCSGCERTIQRALQQIQGISYVHASKPEGKVYIGGNVASEEVINVISSLANGKFTAVLHQQVIK